VDEDEAYARERETKAGDIFQEFQGIVKNRPGAEERGGLGHHWSRLGTCVACAWTQSHGRPSYRDI